MRWLAILLLSILACVCYGVVHDEITARICVEYFTIGHPPVFGTEDPTLLGFGWGVIATWWVGAILGVPLATVSRIGAPPKRDAASLLRPMAVLMACNAALATLAGVVGYVAASHGWVRLVGHLAHAVPPESHVGFLVDLWAHSASYLGGFVGGMVLIVQVWRRRRRDGRPCHAGP